MTLKSLFNVETLDTRFAPRDPSSSGPLPNTQPSKWNTPEYYLYYFFFLTIPPLMFKAVYDVSQPSHPGFKHYEHMLEPGWIPGRLVDNSDAQYRGFRENIPYMLLLLGLHPLLRRAWERVVGGAEEGRVRRRVDFDVAFAAVFLVALHGVSAMKILVILCVNWQLATALPKRYVPAATWAFNVSLLFANELCHGYPFAEVAKYILPPQTTAAGEGDAATQDWGTWLDSYGGLIPRWEILFNITVLRLIAFNFDYIWNLDRRASSPIEKKNLDPSALPERERVAIGARPDDFTFRNYLAYILYSPLYLAGPIITFNDYIAQSRCPLPSITRQRIVPYAVRFALCLLTMELVLHHLYAVAICASRPDWTLYTPFQLSMLGYFNLHVIWLKLLLPWRFFRLWSLCDAVDPPENMVRCMSNNPSTLAFWRAWHRSYNRWIVRYIYVPLGGSGPAVPRWRAAFNYAAVFTFVALWHDINLRLLIWGWLIVLFVAPEALARALFPPQNFRHRPNAYRWLAGVGAVGNILMMMAANLVGFAIGVDGVKGLAGALVQTLGGRVFFVAACATLFVGSMVMFEWRESERRRGIDMKC
ncbi:glycerol uptake protein 1-like [Teratosphaeria destructans]|uniref:Glycerol uptake protein 1-like n=1 Tax=Teratosphaeria destructans TaxID=418781 RepID=A0A9W7SM70_9PEZI|nr:glycerol uptake protein 1-like [Teratosphaeria destructans]